MTSKETVEVDDKGGVEVHVAVNDHDNVNDNVDVGDALLQARATLQQLASAFPENGRVKQRLAGSPAPAR